MISTKGVYIRWLLIFVIFTVVGVILTVLSKGDISGYFIVFICFIMCIINLVKIMQIKRLEKTCNVVQAKFVGVEKDTVGWRNPRFAVTFEFQQGDKKIRVKTRGIYFASDVSGLCDLSLVTIGYTKDFRQVITL